MKENCETRSEHMPFVVTAIVKGGNQTTNGRTEGEISKGESLDII